MIIFPWLLGFMLSALHPFYISMAEIQHNKKNQSIEVSVRIFTDDLEKTIRKTYTGKVDLMNTNEKATSQKLLKDYIVKHLSIKADGKALSLNFVGFEVQQGSIWSYLEAPGIASIKTLEVTDNILYEYHNEQINFIHVKAGNTDETQKLDYPDAYKKFVVN